MLSELREDSSVEDVTEGVELLILSKVMIVVVVVRIDRLGLLV